MGADLGMIGYNSVKENKKGGLSIPATENGIILKNDNKNMPVRYLYLFISASLLSFSLQAQGYEEQYVKCSEPLKGLEVVDSVYFARVGERNQCLAGAMAPDFRDTAVTGEPIELSRLKGRVVVLNFWFTRCQPCIEEMPDMNRLVEHYSGKKVTFLSFAPEDKATLQKFFEQHPFRFTAIAESEDIRMEKFKLFSAWPYAVIIDQEGRIHKMWFGNIGENTFDFYRQIIDGLLGK